MEKFPFQILTFKYFSQNHALVKNIFTKSTIFIISTFYISQIWNFWSVEMGPNFVNQFQKCVKEYFETHHYNAKVYLINALSFYRSQNVLCRSKSFVSDQKFIYILCRSQTYCGWFAFSKIVFCASTKVFEEVLNAVKSLVLKWTFGPVANFGHQSLVLCPFFI